MAAARSRGLSRRGWLIVVVLGFLALCSVMRVPLGVIPPLLPRISADLSLSDTAQGTLSAIPVLCFGLLTPAASAVVRRLGINSAGLAVFVVLILGATLRSLGSTPTLFAGAVLVGAGITVANLVAPMVIGRDFWHKSSIMTGLYAGTCNITVTLATALAVPLAVFWGWQGSTWAWTVLPALPDAALWLWVFPPGHTAPRESLRERSGMTTWVGEARQPAQSTSSSALVPVWRRPLTWLMAGAFVGHVTSYYTTLTWLPSLLAQLTGMSESEAGVAAAVFSLVGIPGPLVVPVMIERLHWSDRRVITVLSIGWLTLPVTLLIAPQAWLIPSIICGVAQGGFFTALFTMVIRSAGSVDENRRITAFVQISGYCAAALGMVGSGWLLEVTDSWDSVLFLLIGLLTLMTVCRLAVARLVKAQAEAQA